jgi:cell division protein FtsL
MEDCVMVKKKRVTTASKKNPAVETIKKLVLSSKGLPLFLSFAVLAMLFVLFRMKGVELDYKISNIDQQIDRISLESKELKARKAKLLSVRRLRRLAKKFGMEEAKQGQIIVIP